MTTVKFTFFFGLLLMSLRGATQSETENEVCKLSEEYFGFGEVYAYVDSMPHYPGGTEMLMKFICSNLKAPEDFISWNSKVVTQFVVDTNGLLRDKKIIKGLNEDLNNAVLAVLDRMPPWVPGRCNGRLVSVVYFLPVIIELQ